MCAVGENIFCEIFRGQPQPLIIQCSTSFDISRNFSLTGACVHLISDLSTPLLPYATKCLLTKNFASGSYFVWWHKFQFRASYLPGSSGWTDWYAQYTSAQCTTLVWDRTYVRADVTCMYTIKVSMTTCMGNPNHYFKTAMSMKHHRCPTCDQGSLLIFAQRGERHGRL